jgi:hypothetical protein
MRNQSQKLLKIKDFGLARSLLNASLGIIGNKLLTDIAN